MTTKGAGKKYVSSARSSLINPMRKLSSVAVLAGIMALSVQGQALAVSGDGQFAGVFATDCSTLDFELNQATNVSSFTSDLIFACDADSGFCGSFLGFCSGGSIPIQQVQPVIDTDLLEAGVRIRATTFANNLSYKSESNSQPRGDLVRVTFADLPEAANDGDGEKKRGGGPKKDDPVSSAGGVVTGRDVRSTSVEENPENEACRLTEGDSPVEYLSATRQGESEVLAILLGSVVGDAITTLSYALIVDTDTLPAAGSQVLIVGSNFNATCVEESWTNGTPLLDDKIIDGQSAYYVIETPGCTKISGTRYCW